MILVFKPFPVAIGIEGGLMRAPKYGEEGFHRTREGARIAKEGEADTEEDKTGTWHPLWAVSGEGGI